MHILIWLGRARRLWKLAETFKGRPWSISIPHDLLYTRNQSSGVPAWRKLRAWKPARQDRQRWPLFIIYRSPSNGAEQRCDNMGRYPRLSIYWRKATILWYMYRGSGGQQQTPVEGCDGLWKLGYDCKWVALRHYSMATRGCLVPDILIYSICSTHSSKGSMTLAGSVIVVS